jgi:hypothetical protein
MPIHDWRRVAAGIFHDFHHAWIEEIKRVLNAGLLPDEYYALAEQHAAGFGPDILTLEHVPDEGEPAARLSPDTTTENGGVALLVAPPQVRIRAETDLQFYRRKQSSVVVRHVSGDRMVAVVEIVSPGNKAGRKAFRSFLDKAGELLERRIHLLILDLFPPTPRDPGGIHAAIWEDLTGQAVPVVEHKPLTLAAYESALSVRAYVEPVAVGDPLPERPLYLQPEGYVLVPLWATYRQAFAALPRRWQAVLNGDQQRR